MAPLKFRLWDLGTKTMSPVARLSLGHDGAGLTILVDRAPTGEYSTPLVVDETAILMQSTGLRDKTRKEIFEGDILQGEAFGIVIFNGGKFTGCYTCSHTTKGWDYSDDWEDDIARLKVEVIGNIYENPDLLQK